MEISAIADDTLKFQRIIAWFTSYPDEVPFALHQFMGRRDKPRRKPPKLKCGSISRKSARWSRSIASSSGSGTVDVCP